VLVEILVFSRQECLQQAFRNRIERHVNAPFFREFGDQAAITGVHARHDRRLVLGEHFIVGKILGDIPQDVTDYRRRSDENDHPGSKQKSQKTQHQTTTPSPLALLRRFDRCCNVHVCRLISAFPNPNRSISDVNPGPCATLANNVATKGRALFFSQEKAADCLFYYGRWAAICRDRNLSTDFTTALLTRFRQSLDCRRF